MNTPVRLDAPRPPAPASWPHHSPGAPRRLFVAAATVGLAAGLGQAHAAVVRLTADAAAERAVAVSHAAAAAGERVNAAEQAVAAADAGARPTLTAAASAAKLSSVPEFTLPFAVPGQQPVVLVPDITTAYGTALRLQQPLYSGGAIDGSRLAARHEAEASRAGRRQTEVDLRASARLAYWQAVGAAAAVNAALAREQRAARLLADTESLLEAGMAVNADVLAAREQAASAGVAVIAARTAAANALAVLASLLRLDPDDSIALADTLAGPLPGQPPPLAELEAQALAGRPELAAAAARIAALRARETVAAAPLRPALGALAEVDYNRPNQRYFPQSDRWRDSWSVGLSASWTLYDGGRTRANTAATRCDGRAAADEREELLRAIRLEVANDRRNLASALATVAAADAAHAAAVEREVAARERHAAGLAAMVEILDAEAQLAAAEQQQIDARGASWIAGAVLARAIGR
jgi:outer membrane protein TolC